MLERFCAAHLPATFADLKLPFAATTTEMPGKRTVMITKGDLASAISASCALRGIRRPVSREGKRLKDDGIVCVLPSEACRTTYPAHYHSAVRSTDLLIHQCVPLAGYLPGPQSIERMISAGSMPRDWPSADSLRKPLDFLSIGLYSRRKCLGRLTDLPFPRPLQGLDGTSLVEMDDCVKLI